MITGNLVTEREVKILEKYLIKYDS